MWLELLLAIILIGLLANLPVILDMIWEQIKKPSDMLKLGLITRFSGKSVDTEKDAQQKSISWSTSVRH